MGLATPTAAAAAWIQAGFTAAAGQSLHEHTQSEGSSHTHTRHKCNPHAHMHTRAVASGTAQSHLNSTRVSNTHTRVRGEAGHDIISWQGAHRRPTRRGVLTAGAAKNKIRKHTNKKTQQNKRKKHTQKNVSICERASERSSQTGSVPPSQVGSQ